MPTRLRPSWRRAAGCAFVLACAIPASAHAQPGTVPPPPPEPARPFVPAAPTPDTSESAAPATPSDVPPPPPSDEEEPETPEEPVARRAPSLPPMPAPAPTPQKPPAVPVYETTVTALRLPRPVPDVPAAVTIISRSEIDHAPALTSDDVLRAVPSAATFRRTPSLTSDPSNQGPNLRGLAPSAVSRTLVLVDGVPVNQPYGGWVYWRGLPRLSLERIEIVPGTGSALFGNYGLGGVVQMFSRPVQDRAQLDLAGGSFGTHTAAAAVGKRFGAFGIAIEPEYLSSEGYVPVAPSQRGAIDQTADSRHAALNARTTYDPSPSTHFSLAGRLFWEKQNGGTAYTRARVRAGALSLSMSHAFSGGTLSATAFADNEAFNQDRTRLVGANRSSEALGASQDVDGTSFGTSVVYTSKSIEAAGRHTLVMGVDSRVLRGSSDEVLTPATVTAQTTISRKSGGDQRFLGAFVEDIYEPAPWLQLTPTVRVDRWRLVNGHSDFTRKNGDGSAQSYEDRGSIELSPRLGVLVRPSNSFRLRASGYTGFRAPTLNELYRPFQVQAVLTAANEKLKAEHVLGLEAGVEYLFDPTAVVRVTGFANRLRDPIVNVTLPAMAADGSTRQRQNVGAAVVRGFESSLDLRLHRFVTTSLGYCLIDSEVTSPPATSQDLKGKRLAQVAKHRGRAALDVRLPDWASALVQARWQGLQYEDDKNTLQMGKFVVVDAFVAVPVAFGVELFGMVENLFDKQYLVGRAAPSPPTTPNGVDTIGPPRLFMAGLRLR